MPHDIIEESWRECVYDGDFEAFTMLRQCKDAFAPYDGMTICPYVDDDLRHVSDNRLALCGALGLAEERIVTARQRHTTNVAVIDSIPDSATIIENEDALVSNLRGLCLGIHTADCIPLLLWDVNTGVYGAVHSGWRGTLGGITARTLEAMQSMGARPEDVAVYIGPGICGNCYEVGSELADRFIEAYPDTYKSFIGRNQAGNPTIDLRKVIFRDLIKSGVREGNMVQNTGCTLCNP